ncbi:putative leucine-rich repeat domain, L domain-containing protein [Rosa chinensis]|uniref:Putative leucine-rich repeat domain, L domain-containing protein n=1 Tax=Rosa chinensis TaxID=74649 RepID=A0A2P6RI11_ROSCH|nr:putative leucine-rich repeat domain, L domain-containing protein [Rosa chinensis]
MGRLKSLESSAIAFRNLTSLAVMNCERLNYLITFPVAKSLTQLTKLKVEKCKRIVVIVESNVGDDDEAENEITFSLLQDLDFSDLPSLQGFCSSRNCAVKFPSLVTLRTNQVPELKQISDAWHGVLLAR